MVFIFSLYIRSLLAFSFNDFTAHNKSKVICVPKYFITVFGQINLHFVHVVVFLLLVIELT